MASEDDGEDEEFEKELSYISTRIEAIRNELKELTARQVQSTNGVPLIYRVSDMTF